MSEQENQRLVDRQAITDLTVRYAWALDHRRFEDLTQVFADDASADYASLGLLQGREEIRTACARSLARFDRTQHIVANHQVDLDGDKASGRCYFHAQHITKTAGVEHPYVVAGSYLDRYTRTGDGWRIAHRVLRVSWTEGTSPTPHPESGPGTSFVIAGWIEIDPDQTEALLEAGATMMRATHQEPGNLDYVFSADPAVPGRIRIFESWRSDADLRGHFETEHMTVFQQALGRAGVRDRDLKRYHVSAVGPVL
jgi:quinol monooxygenase YgiN/3-phenylpropionate/cinnamic acid dioxygenase small subunit